MKKKIAVNNCYECLIEACSQYKFAIPEMMNSGHVSCGCPLEDDRTEELEAEVARLEGRRTDLNLQQTIKFRIEEELYLAFFREYPERGERSRVLRTILCEHLAKRAAAKMLEQKGVAGQ